MLIDEDRHHTTLTAVWVEAYKLPHRGERTARGLTTRRRPGHGYEGLAHTRRTQAGYCAKREYGSCRHGVQSSHRVLEAIALAQLYSSIRPPRTHARGVSVDSARAASRMSAINCERWPAETVWSEPRRFKKYV